MENNFHCVHLCLTEQNDCPLCWLCCHQRGIWYIKVAAGGSLLPSQLSNRGRGGQLPPVHPEDHHQHLILLPCTSGWLLDVGVSGRNGSQLKNVLKPPAHNPVETRTWQLTH